MKSTFDIKPTKDSEKSTVEIPSKFSFLTINLSGIEVSEDENDSPYHSIKIDSNVRIAESEIKKNIAITELKDTYSRREYEEIMKYYGKEADRCFREDYEKELLKLNIYCDLLDSTKKALHPNLIANSNVTYTIKEEKIIDETKYELLIEPKVGSLYQIKMKKGLMTRDGYELEFDKIEMSKAKAFPKILRFANEGSILSLKGDKKVAIYARGISKVRVKIQQIKAHQLHHLLSMSNASKVSPRFKNYSFNSENITDEFNDMVYFSNNLKNGKYTNFDFSKYLNKKTKGSLNYGIFFVKLTDEGGRSLDSQVFILSDMAYIIKEPYSGNPVMHVVSQRNEKPISGAVLKTVAINGDTKLVCETDSDGACEMKDNKHADFQGYILESGRDILYISRYNRDSQVNYSRFNVSGEYQVDKKLRVSIFSDRKLYRPGERGHLAFIFKDKEWSQKYEGQLVNIEITDSRGKTFLTTDQKIREFGYNSLDFDLPYAAPTGSYNISVSSYRSSRSIKRDYRYKHVIANHTLKVQEFLPDKMKISASLNKGHHELWVSPKGLKANVSLRNLFGTPAIGNKIEATLVLNPNSINISKYREYSFYNEKRLEKSLNETLEAKTTNEEGLVEYELDLEKYAKNTFELTFHVEGFMKSGGRSVVTEKKILVSPNKYMVGYKAEGNLSYVSQKSNMFVNLIAIDNTQKTTYANCTLTIYEKKYQNVLVKQADQTYAYQDVKEPIVFKKENISISPTTLEYKLDNSKVGEYIVKITDEEGAVLNQFEYNVVGEADLARSLYRNNELKLELNKSDYANGDQIKFSIKSPYTGVALVTIEKEKVYASKWIRLRRETSEHSIRVPSKLAGNGYLNVSLLRSLDSDKVFTSPFSYAVAAFSIDKSKLVHDIELEAKSIVKPGELVSVRYKSNKRGKIIIYAVDKGIHQLANYVTPRPLDEFYKKQALRVSTYQIFSLVLPDIDSLNSAFASGGGAGALLSKSLNPFKRKFTKAVAFWSDVLESSTKWQKYNFQVPHHFNGELALKAVYVDDQSVGVKSAKIISKDDLIITPTMPMFSAPEDEFTISATIANNLNPQEDKDADKVDVEILVQDHFKVLSKKVQTVQIKRAQDQVVTFKLKTQERLGNAPVRITATLPNAKTSTYEENLSVRPLFPNINRNWQHFITEGEYEIDIDDISFHKEFHELSLDITHGLYAMFAGEIKYLASYPYGCSEQITSKAIPYAIFEAEDLGVSEEKRKYFLEATYNRLLQRQDDSGGIALYSGNGVGSDYLNLYIAHFLTIAKQKNLYVNTRLFERLYGYIKTKVQSGDDRTKAYALYLMAMNEEQVGAQAKLLLDSKPKDIYAKLYLAATFSILKDDKQAMKLIEDVEKSRSKYRFSYRYGYYASSFERVYLGVLFNYFPDKAGEYLPELISNMIEVVKNNGSNSMWSGQTLLAMGLNAKSKPLNVNLELKIKDKTKKLKSSEFSKLSKKEKLNLKSIKFELEKKTIGLFNLNVNGFPRKMASYYKGLQISKRFLNEDGVEVSKVQNGDEVIVELKVQGDREIRNAALVDLLPGGFDLVWNEDKSNPTNEDFRSSLTPEFVDQREDRVIIYTALDTDSRVFYYKIKAIAPGKFKIPPVYGENMYKTVESILGGVGEIEVKN